MSSSQENQPENLPMLKGILNLLQKEPRVVYNDYIYYLKGSNKEEEDQSGQDPTYKVMLIDNRVFHGYPAAVESSEKEPRQDTAKLAG